MGRLWQSRVLLGTIAPRTVTLRSATFTQTRSCKRSDVERIVQYGRRLTQMSAKSEERK